MTERKAKDDPFYQRIWWGVLLVKDPPVVALFSTKQQAESHQLPFYWSRVFMQPVKLDPGNYSYDDRGELVSPAFEGSDAIV